MTSPQNRRTALPFLANYLDNTVPRGKQQEAFDFAAATDLPPLFMEPRTGKTPVALGWLAFNCEGGTIDAALIIAMPSGVPANWAIEILGEPALEKLPRWPQRIPARVLVWRASKAGSKGFKQQAEEFLSDATSFLFLIVNGEAILTEAFQAFAARFLKKRRVAGVADETSLLIKRPGGERYKVMKKLKKRLPIRMILDGTPAEESPFDLFSQLAWLDESFLGHRSFFSFKNHFAVWEKGFDPRSGREYPKMIGFRNLEELRRRLERCSFQVTRAECFDMPAKICTQHAFELSQAQRRVYDQLREEHEAVLSDGTSVSASMVLTRYIRLQQVTSNIWPSEKTAKVCHCGGVGCDRCGGEGILYGETPPKIIDAARNPRLETLGERLEANRDPVVVWARFRHDVDQIVPFLEKLGRKPVRYDGTVPPDLKEANRRLFQTGAAGAIVATQGAMERGVDVSKAGWHCFFSNTFSALQRIQCEDRTELPGRPRGTGVEDLVATDTVDEDIVAAHVFKRSVADYVMGRKTCAQL